MMEDKNTETSRAEQWFIIMGGVRAAFIDDMNTNGYRQKKADKFVELYAKALDEEALASEKVKLIKEMRRCFKDKTNIDHFLYVSGVNAKAPNKRSDSISAVIAVNS